MDPAPQSDPRKLRRVVIKEEFVALTGDPLRAVILNQLLYWSERVRDHDAFLQEEETRNPALSGIMPLRHGWIYKSAPELAEETMLRVTAQTVRNHLKVLVEAGWLAQRQNPTNPVDRTLQYRVDLRAIQRDLATLGYPLDGYTLPDPPTPSPAPHDGHTPNPKNLGWNPKIEGWEENGPVTPNPKNLGCIPNDLVCIPSDLGTIPEITTEITSKGADQDQAVAPAPESARDDVGVSAAPTAMDEPMEYWRDKALARLNWFDLKVSSLLERLREATNRSGPPTLEDWQRIAAWGDHYIERVRTGDLQQGRAAGLYFASVRDLDPAPLTVEERERIAAEVLRESQSGRLATWVESARSLRETGDPEVLDESEPPGARQRVSFALEGAQEAQPKTKLEEAWEVTLKEFQQSLPSATYDTWFRDMKVIGPVTALDDPSDRSVLISVPAFAYDWVVNRMGEQVKRSLTLSYRSLTGDTKACFTIGFIKQGGKEEQEQQRQQEEQKKRDGLMDAVPAAVPEQNRAPDDMCAPR